MKYEVEQKHRVHDVDVLIARLSERAVTIEAPKLQCDRYFAHPQRDFAQTDEALRIRSTGGRSFVTYKGPKIDTTTKTRRELEFPLHDSDADGSNFAELLSVLGFRPVATVRKSRRKFHVLYAGREVEGAMDDVDGVGTFVELELGADETALDQTRRIICELAAELELGPTERRSYLEMLLMRIQP
jgi:adenylate cyclase class 2